MSTQTHLRSTHRHLSPARYQPRVAHVSRGAVQQAFGLTASEAEVAVELFESLSIQTVAARRGVSVNTVKTHLKTVFEKCDVRSQSQLVKLLALGPWMK